MPDKKTKEPAKDNHSPADAAALKEEVKVLRVQPYPIHLDMLKGEGQPKVVGSIVKLTQVGFLAQFKAGLFRGNENWIAQFELPVVHEVFSEGVKVIKTYESLDHYIKGNSTEKKITVEFHFKAIPTEKLQKVVDFLNKIHQKS